MNLARPLRDPEAHSGGPAPTFPVASENSGTAQKEALLAEVTSQFEALRRPVYSYVLSVCGRPEESEDLTQEVFLRLYLHLRDGNRLSSIRAWVFRVAHNLAVNHAKSRRFEVLSRFREGEDSEAMREDHGMDPEQTLEQKERDGLLQSAIETLTSKERQCLHLRVEGLRYREIAEVLSMNMWCVADTLDRTLGKLRGRCR